MNNFKNNTDESCSTTNVFLKKHIIPNLNNNINIYELNSSVKKEKLFSNFFKFELIEDFKYEIEYSFYYNDIDKTNNDYNKIINFKTYNYLLDYYSTLKNNVIFFEFIEFIYKNRVLLEQFFGTNFFIDIVNNKIYSKSIKKEVIDSNYNLSNLKIEDTAKNNYYTLNFNSYNSFNQKSLLNLSYSYVNYLIYSKNKEVFYLKNTIYFFKDVYKVNENIEVIPCIRFKNKYFDRHEKGINSIYFNPNKLNVVVSNNITILHNILNLINEYLSTIISENKFNEESIDNIINNDIKQIIYNKVNNDLSGKEVVTKYNKYAIYSICEIVFDKNIYTCINCKTSKESNISLKDYYYKEYNINIHDEIADSYYGSNKYAKFLLKNQPLIIFKNKDKYMYLIPQLCYIIEPFLNQEDILSLKNLNKSNEEKILSIKSNYKENENSYFNLFFKENNNLMLYTKFLDSSQNKLKQILNSVNLETIKSENNVIDNFIPKFLNIKKIFNISTKPLAVYSYPFNKVKFELNKEESGYRSIIENYNDLNLVENKIFSCGLYNQTPLPILSIIYSENDYNSANIVKLNIDKLIKTNNFLIGSIELFPVKITKDINMIIEWESTIKKFFSRAYTNYPNAIIVILPNKLIEEKCNNEYKNKKEISLLYNYLKKLLIVDYPTISQFIKCQTISDLANSEQSIRLIINKLIIQLLVKLNSEPWKICDIPFSSNYVGLNSKLNEYSNLPSNDKENNKIVITNNSNPTMIIGIYEGFLNNRVTVSLTASYNNNFNKYYSNIKIIEDYKDYSQTLELINELIFEAIDNFSICQTIYPQNIIIFRDNSLPNVSINQFIEEAIHIKTTINSSYNKYDVDILITYILVKDKYTFCNFYSSIGDSLNDSKREKYKRYLNNLNDSYRKTLIVKDNVTNEKNQFYILNTSDNKTYSSTFYHVLVDESETYLFDIEDLCYKLSYLYYNNCYCNNLPAPIKYAKKLAMLVGKNISNEDNFYSHSKKFKCQIKSPFYI